MDIGDLYAGLNALDAVRLQRNPDGSQAGLIVDAEPVVALQAALTRLTQDCLSLTSITGRTNLARLLNFRYN